MTPPSTPSAPRPRLARGTVAALLAHRIGTWLGVGAELGKLRLSALVVVVTAAGYCLALTPAGPAFDPWVLVSAMAGTLLVSAGASAFNQALEMRHDLRMARTRERPVPRGAVSVAGALCIGIGFAAAGLSILCGGAHSAAALVALVSLLLYVLVYTPLKRVTPYNTLVGAVPGALPPLIGWAAATGELTLGAWMLFAILFAWQVPHFLAIAWMYRDQYARAGFKMLPVVDPTGVSTGRAAVVWALALVPLSLCAPMAGLGHWLYAVAAVLLGSTLVLAALMFLWRRTDDAARRLFLASLVYLPALLGVLVIDTSLQ